MDAQRILDIAAAPQWDRRAWSTWLLSLSLVDLHGAVRDHLRRRRDADVVDGHLVPRTTVADALRVGTLWMRVYLVTSETLGTVDPRFVRALDETEAVQAWTRILPALADVVDVAPSTLYAGNPELWGAADLLARQLDAVRWRVLKPAPRPSLVSAR
jgi:hypothetical protein